MILTSKEANDLAATKPPVDDLLPYVQHQINKRRRRWTLTTMAWEDCSQLLLIRVWQKYHLFDPQKGPFEHWLNRLLSHTMTNILRDSYLRYSRPCVRDGGCVFNLGDGNCGYTNNGLQCELCPLYATWQKKKEPEFNIKASVALEHHTQEVNNIQSDFLDIEGAKEMIDIKMLSRLNPWERRVYRLLYIDNLTPAQASEKLKKVATKRRIPLQPNDPVEYQMVLKAMKAMKAMMINIIKTEDLI